MEYHLAHFYFQEFDLIYKQAIYQYNTKCSLNFNI